MREEGWKWSDKERGLVRVDGEGRVVEREEQSYMVPAIYTQRFDAAGDTPWHKG